MKSKKYNWRVPKAGYVNEQWTVKNEKLIINHCLLFLLIQNIYNWKWVIYFVSKEGLSYLCTQKIEINIINIKNK